MKRETQPTTQLAGAAEVGHMLGISRQRVQQLADRKDFPEPVAALTMGKVWRTSDIEMWAKETGRAVVK